MSGPQIGDRVHVEFDGEVTARFEHAVTVRVDVSQTISHVYPAHCTVLAPPVKVGDEVTTPRMLIDLPERSLVARNSLKPWFKDDDGAWMQDGERSTSELVFDANHALKLHVLRVGGRS